MDSILQRLSGPATPVPATVTGAAATSEVATPSAPAKEPELAPANRPHLAPAAPAPAPAFNPGETAGPTGTAPANAAATTLGAASTVPSPPLVEVAPVAAAPAAPAPVESPASKVAEQASSEEMDKASLEGALAQLLRPMVRQWLDQNMTRALETAVRIELADGLKNGNAAAKPGDKA